MPIKRGPDGRILSDGGGDDYDTPTTTTGGKTPLSAPQSGSLSDDYDAPTVTGPTVQKTMQSASATAPTADEDEFDPQTQVVGRQTKDAPKNASRGDPMADPVVGWLVSIAGPGKGSVLQMGYGRNSVGRGADVRLRADFGDHEISRTAHCIVTYDPKSRKYFVQGGEESANLTYLNDAPVLQPTEISAGAQIQIGSTTLRFVPMCDNEFEWQDLSE